MLGLTVFPNFVNNFHFALTLQTVHLLALSAEPSSGAVLEGRTAEETHTRVRSRETRKRAFV